MSNFTQADVSCPCGETLRVRVVQDLFAAALPEERERILSGRFQEHRCPRCGAVTVVESSFIYTDVDRGHYIAVEPPGTEDLAPLVERHRRVFDRCFTEGSPEVQELGLGLRRRLVVGLDRLREKLRLWDADLDDRVVEALKGDTVAELGAACGSVYFVDLLPAGHFVLGLYQGARPTVPPRAATTDPGCLMTVTVTAARYRERAADPTRITVDYPRLAKEWLVDVFAAERDPGPAR